LKFLTGETLLKWFSSIYKRLTNFLKNTFQDRFKRYLIISLIILGIVIGFTSQGTSSTGEGFEVHFFYLPGCSHCDEQEIFNEKLELILLLMMAPHLKELLSYLKCLQSGAWSASRSFL